VSGARRPVDVISAELDNAEKQLGACIEIVTLYPAREVIAKNAAVQRVKWASAVQRLADELCDATFEEEEIV
jgi:hypothetical protein